MKLKQTFLPTILLITTLILAHSLSSCKKDQFLTQGGDISFSTDTLKFDTVFTTIGSVTRSFKLYNRNNKRIKIDEIRLQSGTSSPFRMNIDGEATKSIQNVELAPNDSLYIFVALTIDPTSGVLPFLINEKVIVTLNGNQREVPLEAFGQDAHYIYDSVLPSQTWINDKPYVIIHSALVDSAETLTIQKGCRIYMHQDSKLYVKGALKVFGTKTDSVIFQGDRLDRDYFGYKDYPGEWGGLLFYRSSEGSSLNYCIIKNAGNPTDGFTPAAINVLQPWSGNPLVLEMNYCTIANSSTFGLLGYTTNIKVNNCLIHTCGLQNVAFIEGGTYELNHCTIATYGGVGINHAQQPSVVALNYRDISLTEYVTADLKATFNNCIMYGSIDDEVFFNKKSAAAFDVKLNHCLIKKSKDFDAGLILETNVLKNQDPQFKDYSKWDFRPMSTSPAKASGVYIVSPLLFDLDQQPWANPPSIGCYEVL